MEPVIRFPSTLDAFQVVRMQPRLMRVLKSHPKRLLVDLGATRKIELAGLGMLIERFKRFGTNYSVIRFSNASPQVHRTLIRAGVEGLVLS